MQHLSLTVSDVEAGAAWYTRVPVTFPHHLDGDGVMIGLHDHEGHAADGFAAQAVALAAKGQRRDVRGKLPAQLPVSRSVPNFL